jgi:hypothetical protein
VTDVAAVGFVPAAPLLVPEVAGGSAQLDAELRDACRSAVRRLCEAGADAVVVAATWREATSWPDDGIWDFTGFGVTGRGDDARPRLPWPLGIGAWLLDDAGWAGGRRYVSVGADGRSPAAFGAGRVAVLVVGDGSARRTEKAPGHLDERAEGFDAAAARAIATGDPAALEALDPELAAELMSAGAPAWRWLAGELGSRAVVEAELTSDTAPYGVGYLVGWWRVSG